MANHGVEPPRYDWMRVIPTLIHPVKIGIIEALRRIDEPLSATDITAMFGGGVETSQVSYHMGMLAAAQVVVKVSERPSKARTESSTGCDEPQNHSRST